MGYPIFNNFSLNDDTFITERVVFKGFADRAVIRANLARREGIKLLNTEFGEKEITVEGVVVTDSASDLQTSLDNMKKALTQEEGTLEIESGRSWTASVLNVVIPDEHYSLSKAPFQITFLCTDPFAEGVLLSTIQDIASGYYTYSGSINISGTLFARPTITYVPPSTTGNTNINSFSINHSSSGQEITISGFGSGGLDYDQNIALNMDTLSILVDGSESDFTGGFSRWEPGENNFTVTVSGRHVGGYIQIEYQPRYL